MVSLMLDTMRRKQQLHSGDRSHPFIRKLDKLTPMLSYHGWEKDAREIEWPGAEHAYASIYPALCIDEVHVDRVLASMRTKQANRDGDRSHPELRKLDKLKAALSYEGWRLDAEQVEDVHASFPGSGMVSLMLDTMRRKQQLHSGDRSHPFIRKLDKLTPMLSYHGWEKDAREIEWPGAEHAYASIYPALCIDEVHVDRVLASMRTKQANRDGDRSHPELRELDDLVARLAKQMQAPSASARFPEHPTSAVLWDADTLPIQRLIEEVLNGGSCALSCLGLRPNLTHPKENIRARFRALAIRLHPDKENHPQATNAFVKVRAAHDRLTSRK